MDGIVGRLLLVHDAIHWLGSLAWYIRLPAVLYHSEGLWAGNVLWLLGSPTSTGGAGEQGILAIPWAPGDERTDSGSQQVRSILNPGLTANWIFLQLIFIPEPFSQTKCLPYEIPLKQHICNTRCLPDQISRHPDNSQKKSNSRYSPMLLSRTAHFIGTSGPSSLTTARPASSLPSPSILRRRTDRNRQHTRHLPNIALNQLEPTPAILSRNTLDLNTRHHEHRRSWTAVVVYGHPRSRVRRRSLTEFVRWRLTRLRPWVALAELQLWTVAAGCDRCSCFALSWSGC